MSDRQKLRTVIAIDPGRAKCGVAVVSSAGDVVDRAIVSTSYVGQSVAELAAEFQPEAIVLGDGTAAKIVEDALDKSAPHLSIHKVDERHTSEQARALYVEQNPPRGFKKLVPRTLRVPDAPYDDYVAVILGQRWWNEAERKSGTS